MNRLILALVLAAFTMALVACSDANTPVPEPTPTDEPPQASEQLMPDNLTLVKGPVTPDGLQAILGTPDLGLGENRVAFVLTSPTDLVRASEARVSSLFFPNEESEGELDQTALAVFRPWPYGVRGLYTTSLRFNHPGRWGIKIEIADKDGSDQEVELFFDVNAAASAPVVGSPAIKSNNKTIDDVMNIEELTTGSLQDPELYQTTIAEAVSSGLPSVLVMASPAFCTNAVCGPQVEVLQELKNKYKGQANFIHVDFYDNPVEIQGDLTQARISPTALEWRLPSTEWSFVVGRDGVVSARFEAFATFEELEQALQQVL